MKKPKIVKPFFFRDISHQDMVDILNRENPINLRHNEDLIKRIHARYPLISKQEISVIVMAIFQSFRDLMVLGKVLNFNNLFFDTKFLFFSYISGGKISPSLKIRISTPPPLRKSAKQNIIDGAREIKLI